MTRRRVRLSAMAMTMTAAMLFVVAHATFLAPTAHAAVCWSECAAKDAACYDECNNMEHDAGDDDSRSDCINDCYIDSYNCWLNSIDCQYPEVQCFRYSSWHVYGWLGTWYFDYHGFQGSSVPNGPFCG